MKTESTKHTFRFLGAPHEGSGGWQISHPEEVHHAQKVLRLGVGSIVEVFDGAGIVTQGEIASSGTNQILVAVKTSTSYTPPKNSIHIILSVLRTQLVEESIPSLVEVGVNTLHLYAHPQCMKKSLTQETLKRFHRIALNALKQSKGAFLFEIKIWNNLKDIIDFLRTLNASVINLNLDGENFLQAQIKSKTQHHGLICANEAGYTKDDLLLIQEYNIPTRSLGPQVLRASTALAVGGALYRLKLDA